jgi:hypothetical protein
MELRPQKVYTEYELQGVLEDKLASTHFAQVEQRMATEEATCQLQNAESSENK